MALHGPNKDKAYPVRSNGLLKTKHLWSKCLFDVKPESMHFW